MENNFNAENFTRQEIIGVELHQAWITANGIKDEAIRKSLQKAIENAMFINSTKFIN